jgi:predicted nucleotide-binding protein (sugar kinase/HSP70/actin superfamily)
MGVFMKIGIPKGLLYPKYHTFAENFFSQLGADIIVSPDTNKEILDEGVKRCVDDACLPVKVFHGHVYWLRDKCDAVLLPRFVTLEEKKYICPMFCGLTEMISNSIQQLPPLICEPVFSLDTEHIFDWAVKSAKPVTANMNIIRGAFAHAMAEQNKQSHGVNNKGFPLKIALSGHIYNLCDSFVNMSLIKKLNRLGIGVVTPDCVDKADIETEVGKLFKKPFWYFAQQYYGSAVHLYKSGGVDGIIYVSAFSCGVDSVVVELIRSAVGGFPFMVLKIDEHTGEAAFDTRIEAFADMLKRRAFIGNNSPQNGQYLPCGQSFV